MTREECGRQRYEVRYVIRAILDARGLSMAELGRRHRRSSLRHSVG